jgi:hypothetical protein
LLQPQKLGPALTPRRASLFTINALQTGQCGTVSDKFVLAADFWIWRLSRDARMARMRPRSSFSLSQYNGIPTTTIRTAQTMTTDSTFPNRAWVNWSICTAAMPRCSKIPSPFKVFFLSRFLIFNSAFYLFAVSSFFLLIALPAHLLLLSALQWRRLKIERAIAKQQF